MKVGVPKLLNLVNYFFKSFPDPIYHISIIIKDSFFKMAKGYWLSTGSIKDGEGMQPYLKALQGWLPSVNGKFFARDLATIEKESTLGHLTVIIEFPSKEDALSAYESEEYQKMIPLRTPYSDLTLTIFEGV